MTKRLCSVGFFLKLARVWSAAALVVHANWYHLRSLGLFLQLQNSKGKSSRRLELAFWTAAWDRYSLAAAMVGMLSFNAAMAHKCNVIEVSFFSLLGAGRLVLLHLLLLLLLCKFAFFFVSHADLS